jgi:DNA-binding MarR family transcriptional regulator
MTHPARKTLGFQLAGAARAHRALLAGHLDELGLFPGQERILHLLSTREAASVGDLSRVLGVRPPTVSKSVNRLAAEGLVERKSSPDDSRVVLVSLTAEGRSRLQRLEEKMEEAEADMVSVLGEKDSRRLRKLLRKLSRGLAVSDADDGEAAAADDDEAADEAA